MVDQLDSGQRDGAALELGLQGDRVDGIVGHRVNRQVLAKHIVPVEGRKAVAGTHTVGDQRRQHRTSTQGAHFHRILGLEAQARGIVGVDFHERAGVEFVQGGDLAGLGQGVPLVLHAAGVEHERETVVGHFCRRHMGAREELAFAAVGGKRERAGSAVADRVAVSRIGRRAGPLQRLFTQACITGAADVVAGLGVPGAFDFFEHLAGAGVGEGLGKAHFTGDPGDDLPVRQGLAGRLDGFLHQRQVAFGVDHHPFGLGP